MRGTFSVMAPEGTISAHSDLTVALTRYTLSVMAQPKRPMGLGQLVMAREDALALADAILAALGHGREVTAPPDDKSDIGPDDDTITLERAPEPPARPPCACLGAGCSECAR